MTKIVSENVMTHMTPDLKVQFMADSNCIMGTLALLMLAIKLTVVKVAQCTSVCASSFSSFQAHKVAKMMQGAFKMNLY